MKRKAFRAAFPHTLPILAGFLFLGMSYGFLMRSRGFSFLYPLFMSFFIYAGSLLGYVIHSLFSRKEKSRPGSSLILERFFHLLPLDF